MKMSNEHYTELENAISPLLNEQHLIMAKELGFSKSRFVWEIYHKAMEQSMLSEILYEILYVYFDSHIETALNKIYEKIYKTSEY